MRLTKGRSELGSSNSTTSLPPANVDTGLSPPNDFPASTSAVDLATNDFSPPTGGRGVGSVRPKKEDKERYPPSAFFRATLGRMRSFKGKKSDSPTSTPELEESPMRSESMEFGRIESRQSLDIPLSTHPAATPHLQPVTLHDSRHPVSPVPPLPPSISAPPDLAPYSDAAPIEMSILSTPSPQSSPLDNSPDSQQHLPGTSALNRAGSAVSSSSLHSGESGLGLLPTRYPNPSRPESNSSHKKLVKRRPVSVHETIELVRPYPSSTRPSLSESRSAKPKAPYEQYPLVQTVLTPDFTIPPQAYFDFGYDERYGLSSPPGSDVYSNSLLARNPSSSTAASQATSGFEDQTTEESAMISTPREVMQQVYHPSSINSREGAVESWDEHTQKLPESAEKSFWNHQDTAARQDDQLHPQTDTVGNMERDPLQSSFPSRAVSSSHRTVFKTASRGSINGLAPSRPVSPSHSITYSTVTQHTSSTTSTARQARTLTPSSPPSMPLERVEVIRRIVAFDTVVLEHSRDGSTSSQAMAGSHRIRARSTSLGSESFSLDITRDSIFSIGSIGEVTLATNATVTQGRTVQYSRPALDALEGNIDRGAESSGTGEGRRAIEELIAGSESMRRAFELDPSFENRTSSLESWDRLGEGGTNTNTPDLIFTSDGGDDPQASYSGHSTSKVKRPAAPQRSSSLGSLWRRLSSSRKSKHSVSPDISPAGLTTDSPKPPKRSSSLLPPEQIPHPPPPVSPSDIRQLMRKASKGKLRVKTKNLTSDLPPSPTKPPRSSNSTSRSPTGLATYIMPPSGVPLPQIRHQRRRSAPYPPSRQSPRTAISPTTPRTPSRVVSAASGSSIGPIRDVDAPDGSGHSAPMLYIPGRNSSLMDLPLAATPQGISTMSTSPVALDGLVEDYFSGQHATTARPRRLSTSRVEGLPNTSYASGLNTAERRRKYRQTLVEIKDDVVFQQVLQNLADLEDLSSQMSQVKDAQEDVEEDMGLLMCPTSRSGQRGESSASGAIRQESIQAWFVTREIIQGERRHGRVLARGVATVKSALESAAFDIPPLPTSRLSSSTTSTLTTNSSTSAKSPAKLRRNRITTTNQSRRQSSGFGLEHDLAPMAEPQLSGASSPMDVLLLRLPRLLALSLTLSSQFEHHASPAGLAEVFLAMEPSLREECGMWAGEIGNLIVMGLGDWLDTNAAMASSSPTPPSQTPGHSRSGSLIGRFGAGSEVLGLVMEGQEADDQEDRLSFMDIIVTPIQRALRYKLLFQELLGKIPHGSSTHLLVTKALEASERLASECNDRQTFDLNELRRGSLENRDFNRSGRSSRSNTASGLNGSSGSGSRISLGEYMTSGDERKKSKRRKRPQSAGPAGRP